MADMKQYKCPCCGGAIAFDSATQHLKCPFCDTEFDLDILEGYDSDVNNEEQTNMNWDTGHPEDWGEDSNIGVYVCKSCGGEIVADENTAATSCPFCGNPVVMTGNVSGVAKPDMVIPFKMDKEEAKKAYEKHISGKRLLPKVFKEQNHIDEIKGVYIPFWVFDAKTNAHMRYKATKVHRWSDSDYDYEDTEYYSVVRGGSLNFEGVPVNGSKQMPDDLMESLEPFDLSGAVDFKSAYLAGYLADKYDINAEESSQRANERIENSTAQEFANTVTGYNSVSTEACNISLAEGKSRYALYPVWILNTTWNEQKFTFAMNGQTGKMVGDLPADKGALWRWFAGLTVGIGAVAFLIQLLLF